jgi:hypothetical protein
VDGGPGMAENGAPGTPDGGAAKFGIGPPSGISGGGISGGASGGDGSEPDPPSRAA